MNKLLFLAIAAGAALPAQTVTVCPSDHTNVANGSTSSPNLPYAYGISRVQAVYESWDLLRTTGNPNGMVNGSQITRIGFRCDGNATNQGYQLQLEVSMASTNKTAADLSGTYATNYTSGTPTTVFGPALFTLPTLTGASTVWLTLSTPHTFNASENLLLEWKVSANSNGNSSFTYRLDRGTFVSPTAVGASGCQHSGGQIPTLSLTSVQIGRNLGMYLRQGPRSSLVALFVNVNAPMPSPYPLTLFIPTISPTCTGQIDLTGVLSTTSTTNTSGNHNWNVTIPNDRIWWNDALVTAQCVCFDFFSPGGAVVSNAAEVEIGIDPAVTYIYSQGDPNAISGSIARNYGIVTMFEYQ